jgi:hypothetical protein
MRAQRRSKSGIVGTVCSAYVSLVLEVLIRGWIADLEALAVVIPAVVRSDGRSSVRQF